MTVVLDASVILKWLLADPAREPDTDKATALLSAVVAGRTPVLQPPHWLAEVAAVLARLSPESAIEDVERLEAMQFPVSEAPSLMREATALAVATGQHVFDTLYHAVALEEGDATLITADDRYLRKTQGRGRIISLHDWVATT